MRRALVYGGNRWDAAAVSSMSLAVPCRLHLHTLECVGMAALHLDAPMLAAQPATPPHLVYGHGRCANTEELYILTMSDVALHWNGLRLFVTGKPRAVLDPSQARGKQHILCCLVLGVIDQYFHSNATPHQCTPD